MVATRDRLARKASVPLVSPAKASPTTGRTGAPQPTTLQGPVEKPRTLVTAPAIPPARVTGGRHPAGADPVRWWTQSAKYVPKRSAIPANRTRSDMSTAKPHSGPPKGLSAENQKRTRPGTKATFRARGTSRATRNAGSFGSHGLNVKKSTGFRTRESTASGSAT